jgi:hypothetical protein
MHATRDLLLKHPNETCATYICNAWNIWLQTCAHLLDVAQWSSLTRCGGAQRVVRVAHDTRLERKSEERIGGMGKVCDRRNERESSSRRVTWGKSGARCEKQGGTAWARSVPSRKDGHPEGIIIALSKARNNRETTNPPRLQRVIIKQGSQACNF